MFKTPEPFKYHYTEQSPLFYNSPPVLTWKSSVLYVIIPNAAVSPKPERVLSGNSLKAGSPAQ